MGTLHHPFHGSMARPFQHDRLQLVSDAEENKGSTKYVPSRCGILLCDHMTNTPVVAMQAGELVLFVLVMPHTTSTRLCSLVITY